MSLSTFASVFDGALVLGLNAGAALWRRLMVAILGSDWKK